MGLTLIYLIRVRHISDTSERDEREVCWCQDERIWGHTAVSGQIGAALGGALAGEVGGASVALKVCQKLG